MTAMNLCACGCGTPVKRTWVSGHNAVAHAKQDKALAPVRAEYPLHPRVADPPPSAADVALAAAVAPDSVTPDPAPAVAPLPAARAPEDGVLRYHMSRPAFFPTFQHRR